MALAFFRPPAESRASRIHWPLLACALSIAGLGLYNMHSSASHRAPGLWGTQAMWLACGLVVLGALARLDYRWTKALAYVALAATTLALALVLLMGRHIMGARRWLSVGPLTVQPSELAKLALVFGLARYFSSRLPPQGYSIQALMRPLLWTRPAAGAALLLLRWRRPWLVDPVGELARLVHARLPAPPPLADLLYARLALLAIWAMSLALGTWAIASLARQAALLHPWPAARRRRLQLGWLAVHLALLAWLALHWSHPCLTDPSGFALSHLWQAAEPGGPCAVRVARLWPRAGLAALLGAWALLAWSVGPSSDPEAHRLLAPVDLLAVPALLVLVQPDLGSAMLLVLTGASLVLAVGLRPRSLVYLGGLSTFVGMLGWLLVLQEYQKRRIWTFMDPEQDVRGAGWNAVQSLIAVGSGRFFGKGHKNGTQTQLSFLPEQHTDFAFSVWAEEQGLFGCTMLLLLYFSLGVLGWQIALKARDTYGALLATGLVSLLLWQAVINVGMVIGALPVVGIPLPLFSYGGSSVLIVMAAIGLLQSVHARARA